MKCFLRVSLNHVQLCYDYSDAIMKNSKIYIQTRIIEMRKHNMRKGKDRTATTNAIIGGYGCDAIELFTFYVSSFL